MCQDGISVVAPCFGVARSFQKYDLLQNSPLCSAEQIVISVTAAFCKEIGKVVLSLAGDVQSYPWLWKSLGSSGLQRHAIWEMTEIVDKKLEKSQPFPDKQEAYRKPVITAAVIRSSRRGGQVSLLLPPALAELPPCSTRTRPAAVQHRGQRPPAPALPTRVSPGRAPRWRGAIGEALGLGVFWQSCIWTWKALALQ